MKTKFLVSVIVVAMLVIALLPMPTRASVPNIKIHLSKDGCYVDRYYSDLVSVETLEDAADPLPPEVLPFYVDIVDAEKVCETGEGIYVAVLDTGLLSNYLDFFPEGVVDIKEEWGKGFTHDVTYNPVTMKLDYGPLRDDRGFITHDYLNPADPWGIGLGSGHGTHMASIITGWYYNSRRGDGIQYWVKGVAPKVTIIPVLVWDDWLYLNTTDGEYWLEGSGTDEMVAAGIRYVGDLAKAYKVKIVINMSFGWSAPSQIIEDAINYAICEGVIIVASAGNQGTDGMHWPGAYPQVISAAAAGWTQEYIDYYLYPPPSPGNPDMRYYWWTKDVPENLWTTDPLSNKFQVYLTDFSSRPNEALGQHIWDLDVSAPGAGIKGPYKPYGSGQWNYYSVWGTTPAAPHVSAIATLVLAEHPQFTQNQVESIFKEAASNNPLTREGESQRTATIYDIFYSSIINYTWFSNDYGSGLLQADEALDVAGTKDLAVFSPDIAFSHSNPSEGQHVTISADIHNLGEGNLENIIARFLDGNRSIGEQQISALSHHSQGTTSIDWTAEGEGFHLIKVVVDPYDNITETEENNNEATRSIIVGEIPSFGGIIVNDLATPNETRTGSRVPVKGYAEYNTTYGAGEPVAGAEVTIAIIGWLQETTYTIKDGTYSTHITAPYAPGNYTIVVTVTDYTFWQSIDLGLAVTQETGIDITLSHHDISFSPPNPVENDNVEIMATIHNVGTENVTNILVAFYDDDDPIENRIIDLIPRGGSEHATISWNATPWRWHTIKVVIDPENTIEELSENNNEASKNIYVYPQLPDLTPTSIDFSDSTPLVNQTITISATIKNIGGVQANDILVSFHNGNQSIGNATIPCISGKGDSRTASITYSFLTSGLHVINATVDVVNNITEADENNNWFCRSIFVHSSSPDLTLSSSDIVFSSSILAVGDTITINATIHNVGEADAYDVIVEFFDWDSRIGLPIIIPSISATEYTTVEVEWNATPPRWHRIKVVVDGNNAIKESNENNNVASRYVFVAAPDLCIYSEDIVFSNTNPDPYENVTIYATVHNIGDVIAQDVNVTFYVDDNPLGSPQIIPFIAIGNEETVLTTWNATGLGSHVIKVEIMYTRLEYSEENNVATKAIIVGKYDVATTNVTISKTVVGQGYNVSISVTVENQGDYSETFNITVYANTTIVETRTNITLASGNSATVTFTWNTSGFAKGNYTISAYASPVLGEADTADNTYIDGTVKIVKPPVAAFTYSPTTPLTGQTVSFNASLSTPDGGTIISYEWNFGNGTNATGMITTHAYTDNGTYTVTLTVTDDDGLTDTDSQNITVLNRPDIAVTNVTLSKTVVGQGYNVSLSVTVENQGDYSETFNITAYANTTIIETKTNITLTSENSTTLTFTWNTTGFVKGNYTIKAIADTISGEIDTKDNTYIDGYVVVAMVGDIIPDGTVDIFDLVYVALSFGAEYGKPPPPGTQPYQPNADLNGDGIIDIFDIVTVALHYGETDT